MTHTNVLITYYITIVCDRLNTSKISRRVSGANERVSKERTCTPPHPWLVRGCFHSTPRFAERRVRKILSIILIATPCISTGAPIPDYQFKSPSFNGTGYSSHVLTIENQEFTRKAQIQKDIQAALDKAKADKQNTNIAKFLNNLESRIYAQISQNLATAMFANGGTNSGTLNFEGNTIFWSKDGSNINMTVTDMTGNQTTVTIPLGSFQFPAGVTQ